MDGVDEECRKRFEAHRRGGGTEPLEAFLPARDDALFPATLEELVLIDFEFRWKAWCRAPDGQPPTVSDVRTRFPDLDDAAWARLEEESRWLPAQHEARAPDARIGRYLPGRRLGRGASAIVYRAHDPDLGRDVALKVAHPELARHPNRVERVRREARSAARLRHPGIVTVHEVGDHDGCPYFALELVDGETLRARLARRAFEPQAAAELMARLGDAVGYAHEMGVVHRDIKPGNILLEADGRPRLTDFGLAHLTTMATELTRHGEVLGTPAYMAPEQARGEAVDESADVYALGVLLYELLTGRRPFEAPTAEATLYSVVHDTPTAPTTLRPDVPDDLETICLKAMAKEPERRYRSAQAFSSDLRAYLTHQPIAARPPGLADRVLLWRRRNPALAISIAGGLVAVIVVGLIGLTNVLRERSRFRHQRDVAEQNLVASLLGQASSLIDARGVNWKPRANDLIARAAGLLHDEEDLVEARTLLARSESALGPSLTQRAVWRSAHGAPHTLSASPDRQAIAALTDGGALLVRGLSDDAPRRSTALEGTATSLLWCEDVLLVGYDDGRLEVRDAETLTAQREIELGSAVDAFAAHPEEALAAVGLRGGAITVRAVPGFEERVALEGHGDGVTALAFSPEGERLASAGLDFAVRFWRWRDGVELASASEADVVRLVAFLDGRSALTSTAEQYGFRLVDLDDEHALPTIWRDERPSGPITSMFATRGPRVVTTSTDGTITIWSVDRSYGVTAMGYAAHGTTAEGAIRTAAVLDGDRRLAVAHVNGSVSTWDLEARGVTQRFLTHQGCAAARSGARIFSTEEALRLDAPSAPLPYRVDPVVAMAHGGPGETVFLRRSGDLVARTLDRENVVETGLRPATALGVFGDRRVVGAADGRLWIGRRTRAARTLAPGLGGIHGVVDLPDRDALLVLGAEGLALVGPGGAVEVLDRHGRKEPAMLARHGDVVAIGMPDGAVEIWSANALRRERVLSGHVHPVSRGCFAEGGGSLLSVDVEGEVRLFDLASGKTRFTSVVSVRGGCAVSRTRPIAAVGARFIDLDAGEWFATAIVDREVSTLAGADGFVVAGGRGGAWRVPDAALDEALVASRALRAKGLDPGVRTLDLSGIALQGGHPHRLWSVATSPDGRYVATAGHAGSVVLWRAEDLSFVRQVRGPGPLSWTVAFSPDSTHIACGSGGRVEVHAVATGESVATLVGHERLVTSVRFSPREPLLVTTGSDSAVRLWDASTWASRGRLDAGGVRIVQVAFSPDGRRLAGAGRDGVIYVWDLGEEGLVDGLAPTRRLEHPSSVWCVAFDPTGTLLASGAEDGSIRIHDAASGGLRIALQGAPRLRNLVFSADGAYLVGACWAAESTAWDLHTLRARLRSVGVDWE